MFLVHSCGPRHVEGETFTKINLSEQHLFALSLIIEGATEKASQFVMPLSSICIKTFVLNGLKKVFLNSVDMFKQ
jgi:hypothetical protein